ncbi:hypothetical protein [Peribacillus asahii]|uniref:hypothetical protein n=1 Tax=Peribacillus asahii TaxID=228899 RepID=UPI0020796E1B|nr:hypothetical protein [Peribacillus asahii]USK68901.1 hypothetical protein LIS76_15160 [Peribacillus asahii]
MMAWALAILFGVAVILFILSFIKTDSPKVEDHLEKISLTFGEEVNQLQEKIRTLEIDAEITAQEAGILAVSSEQRILLREVLDLHKRGYSVESIAMKTGQNTNQIERLIAPYVKTKQERGSVANDI